MNKYFSTLDATRNLYYRNCTANGEKPDKGKLMQAMKSALRRHHDIGAEANHVIKTYYADKHLVSPLEVENV